MCHRVPLELASRMYAASVQTIILYQLLLCLRLNRPPRSPMSSHDSLRPRTPRTSTGDSALVPGRHSSGLISCSSSDLRETYALQYVMYTSVIARKLKCCIALVYHTRMLSGGTIFYLIPVLSAGLVFLFPRILIQ